MEKVPYVLYNYTPKACDCSKQGFMSLAYNNMVSDNYHVIDRQQTDRQTDRQTDTYKYRWPDGENKGGSLPYVGQYISTRDWGQPEFTLNP